MAAANTADVLIVGSGAAGLAAGVFAARASAGRVILLDGAARVGAKILVSGGSRCNVTNRVVTEKDFWGGERRVVRNVLRAFPASRTVEFFDGLGVTLQEEDDGKYFPTTNRSRTVLDALVRELSDVGAELHAPRRVSAIERLGDEFVVSVEHARPYRARVVVLATGGRSLPKTGSDGAGYELARQLGHGYVDTTPALVPLVTDDQMHEALAGVSHPAAVRVRTGADARALLEGAMLWTHFGVSGPLMLNASRHWLRARLNGVEPDPRLSIMPGDTLESLDAWLLDEQRSRPRASIRSVLSTRLPASVASVWVAIAQVDPDVTLSHLHRDARRRLVDALLDTPLQIRESRGYNYAEVTAGGIPLTEIDSATMESRVCPGLFLVGEVLDVDGRLGGFNFQWAWSSAWVAAQAIAKRMTRV